MFLKINADLLKEQEADKSWYRDADKECDLFVWQTESGVLTRFQFWYKRKLFEWDSKSGYKSGALDAEVGSFKNYQSPSYHYHQEFNERSIDEMIQILQDDPASDDENSIFNSIINKIRESIR